MATKQYFMPLLESEETTSDMMLAAAYIHDNHSENRCLTRIPRQYMLEVYLLSEKTKESYKQELQTLLGGGFAADFAAGLAGLFWDRRKDFALNIREDRDWVFTEVGDF